MRPEWVFAVLALTAGSFMAFVTPPFQSPDEDAHFWRAFQLSEGGIIAQRQGDKVGGDIPVSITNAGAPFVRMRFHADEKADKELIEKLVKEPFAEQPRVWREFMHTAIYSPVAYAPAVVGIWAGKMFGLSALGMMYAARVATLLCWAVLVFAAIRLTPVFKWVTLLIGLLPMSVFLAGSPSADVMTDALAMLLAAAIFRSAFGAKGRMDWREAAWLLTLSVLLSLTKQLYFLLAAMVLMIPAVRFSSPRRKVMFFLGVMGATIVVNAGWACAVRGIVVTEEWANPKEQIAFMMSNPFKYVQVLWSTLQLWWPTYIDWFTGVLGWLDTWLPRWIYDTFPLVLLAAAGLDSGEGRAMKLSERGLVAAICGVTLLLIATSQYITYSAPMANLVRGVQGRYFIPLAVPMLLLLYNRKVKVPGRWLGAAVTVYCAAVLVVTCASLVERYYA
jgi:uncharacterized membrane protein